ncbi:P-loop containing nucleoside triphosphate hydrolase protein [Thelephora terrestris]|uniref:P-loop containing nucleoside triphosphate hydrolase protein n=1 Tax=Thelephora terrestris TaxID=56493 RepID=A0A9P6H9G8_9AGAM|nr:P-loop containing nucleoside triphosphate hydrolase protein [Thelephora terrestris]
MFPNVKVPPPPPLRDAGGQHSLPPIGIAVMGATGSGKSSFINTASGSHLRVGKNLKSCTAEVEVADFILDGRQVILIDTPGFDDTNVSDAEILKKIAAFLAVTYKSGSRLAGIIYIHRISDDRFTGISVRNFKMFRQLCGDSTLKNVVLVTNMWGRVEKDVGEAHEKELAEVYFRPALEKDAQLARHHNTTQSAHEILRRIMKNDPAPLLIQRELVDEGKDIKHTSAGVAVNEELNKAMKRHEAEMDALREDMRQALEEKDEWMRKELEKEASKLKVQMDRVRMDAVTMAAKYDEERKRMEQAMQRMQEQAVQERQKAHEEHTIQINELRAKLEGNTNTSASEREELLRRIHELESQQIFTTGPSRNFWDRCVVM